MADALGRLGRRPLLLSAVGDDLAGQFLLRDTLAHLDTQAVRVVSGGRTAAYTLLLSSGGECHTGAGDMDIHGQISTDLVQHHRQELVSSALVILDGNTPSETISYVLQQCHTARVPVWFEPTDIHKAAKPFRLESWKTLDFISPNINELRIMCEAAGFSGDFSLDSTHFSDEKVIEKATAMGIFLAENVRTVIATLGHLGVIICRKNASHKPFFSVDENGHIEPVADESACPEAHYFPAPRCQPVSVSGAGDCWNSGFIAAALQGKSETACVEAGFNAALCSLAVTSAVPHDIKI